MRVILITLCVLACGPGNEDTATDFTWAGGEFDFVTVATEDNCLNGALEVLFMPEGPDSAHEFEYPVYLPAYDELPMSYSIDLRDPFIGMEITVQASENGGLTIRDSIMESVELGSGTYGDCVATMSVDADITPTSTTSAEVEARIEISDARGEEERCPVLDSNPCAVDLSIIGDAN